MVLSMRMLRKTGVDLLGVYNWWWWWWWWWCYWCWCCCCCFCCCCCWWWWWKRWWWDAGLVGPKASSAHHLGLLGASSNSGPRFQRFNDADDDDEDDTFWPILGNFEFSLAVCKYFLAMPSDGEFSKHQSKWSDLQLGSDDEDPDIFVGGNDDNASTRTSSDNECGGDDNGWKLPNGPVSPWPTWASSQALRPKRPPPHCLSNALCSELQCNSDSTVHCRSLQCNKMPHHVLQCRAYMHNTALQRSINCIIAALQVTSLQYSSDLHWTSSASPNCISIHMH